MTGTAGAGDGTTLDDGYYQDPGAVHARLREQCPVTEVTLPDGSRAWLVSRHGDVRAALASPLLYKDWRRVLGQEEERHPLWTALESHMLNSDPPDHSRLRRLVAKAFTPGRTERLRPRVAAIAESLLSALPASGETDLLAGFAFPLPITVICELLGIPPEDRDDFRSWSSVVVSDDARQDDLLSAATAMHGYFTGLFAAKRADPADDLLSALIAAQDAGDRLSEAELTSMTFLLLVAGHETTVNLIAGGMLALLQNPAEASRLRADPSLLPGAVDELLRYTSPVNHATYRFTGEPVEIGGTVIPARQPVLAMISSANHDPARYSDPDRLDLGRDAGGSLAFGHGIHYCLGAPLARMEAEIAFGALLSRFPSMRLAVPARELTWRKSTLIHGLAELPVVLA